MELKTSKEIMPVVEINYQELKTSLTAEMEKYRGIVVTDDTLKGCKATQKELAGLKRSIDDYRKTKKKELSAPIAAFENQCKELISIIDQVEKPIKEGIAVYDNKKKEAKMQIAVNIAADLAMKNGLNGKYANMIEMKPKYTNISASEKSVREDIQMQVELLKAQQIAEEEKIRAVSVAIENANKRLEGKMQLADFDRFLHLELSEILKEVDRLAEALYAAEHIHEDEVAEPAESAEIKTYSVTLTGDASLIEKYIDEMDRKGIDVEIGAIL